GSGEPEIDLVLWGLRSQLSNQTRVSSNLEERNWTKMNSGSFLVSSLSPNFMSMNSLSALIGRMNLKLPSMMSLVPYTMDGPFKKSMNFFLRLAWSSKIQLPVLIAVCFMAFDIRLQLEINIFWDANHRQPVNPDNNRFVPNRDGNAAFIAAQTTLNLDGIPSDLEMDDDESFSESDDDDEDCKSSSDITDVTSTICFSESFDSDQEGRFASVIKSFIFLVQQCSSVVTSTSIAVQLRTQKNNGQTFLYKFC
ncbi:unnamed protein product, partial [Allacma fusca]